MERLAAKTRQEERRTGFAEEMVDDQDGLLYFYCEIQHLTTALQSYTYGVRRGVEVLSGKWPSRIFDLGISSPSLVAYCGTKNGRIREVRWLALSTAEK